MKIKPKNRAVSPVKPTIFTKNMPKTGYGEGRAV